MKNRDNARKLEHKPICPNCGEQGPHFVGPSLGMEGFWTCPKLYDANTGRRITK